MSSISKGRSEGNIQEWCHKIKSAQTERLTPEVIERIQTKARQTQMATMACKKASRLETLNSMATRSVTLSFQSAAAPSDVFQRRLLSAPAPASAAHAAQAVVPAEGSAAIQQNEGASETLSAMRDTTWQSMSALNSRRHKAIQALAVSARRDDEDEEEVEMLHQEINLQANLLGQGADAEDATASIKALLSQLEMEPTDDAEMAAKFSLFEDFLATVSTIREETINFWNENKAQFEGQTKAAGQKDINAIDSADALGIMDGGRFWFVHSMTEKANSNSVAISRTLAQLRARLEILAGDLGDCPYCLEQMEKDESTTLGCCHKVCTVCWDHWAALKGPAAFCPLCKHTEFIEEVANAEFSD